ncbi:MAG: DUF2177 family protein [Halobacteriovoraceae bacterium]|nr:DUF2177 family protein [Halobacteriovoraceae bacterium]MCB9095799.1 DUF2177 family protein [Halobacteriovoraceae bacterium]
MTFLKHFSGTFGFILILDYLWLGLIANRYFRELLMPIARMDGEKISVHYPSAFIVYLLMGLAVELLIIKNSLVIDLKSAALLGAFLGLVIYGVYDFTNYALLKNYPVQMLYVDVLWGTFLMCAVSALSFYFHR